MANQRPSEVTAAHLAKTAVVYIRQSTEMQVEKNTGSTDYQRAQDRIALAWGWTRDAIEIVDDLGLSGTTTVNRLGYRRMFKQVQSGLVGAIFASDLSRLGRDTEDSFVLLKEMRLRDVLLVVDGKVQDLQNASQLLLTRMMALVAEHDNASRRETLRRGMIAKARAGHAVTCPPRGYVQDPQNKGKWQIDPDPAVESAVRAVFRFFRDHRHLRPAVVALNQAGILLPSRRGGPAVRWSKPSATTILELIRNPAYKGEYHYLTRQVDHAAGRTAKGAPRQSKAAPGVTIVHRDHHPAYVTLAEWDEMRAILKLNAPTTQRRSPGSGNALVQGMIRCRVHQCALRTTYGRSGRPHYYQCVGDYLEGEKLCRGVPGRAVDRLVTEAVFERLVPPRLEQMQQAFEQARSDEGSERRRQRAELERARQKAAKLEDSCVAIDPRNQHVVQTLEGRLREAKLEVRRLELAMTTELSEHPPTFEKAEFEELITLCSDLRRLWDAPTTTDSDKKEIACTLIKEVWLEARNTDKTQLRIVWKDGAPDTHLEIRRPPDVHRVMAELAMEGLDEGEITRRLNAMGLRTKRDQVWCKKSVRYTIWIMRQRGKLPPAPARPGPAHNKDSGASDSATTAPTEAHLEIRRPPRAHRIMAELAKEGIDEGEITRRLNAMGLRTKRHRVWCERIVRYTIWDMRQRGKLPAAGGVLI